MLKMKKETKKFLSSGRIRCDFAKTRHLSWELSKALISQKLKRFAGKLLIGFMSFNLRMLKIKKEPKKFLSSGRIRCDFAKNSTSVLGIEQSSDFTKV
jgi:hypothetical protein